MSSLSVNRIDQRFAELRARQQKAFVAYITAGDPNLDATVRLAQALEKAGVDVLELGVPFSDPLADGMVNQLAAGRALKTGTNLRGILRAVKRMRARGVRIPLVLFTYFNPIHRHGLPRFIREAARAGVDGILNLDLPIEESGPSLQLMEKAGLHAVSLIAPTTSPDRMAAIAHRARGFIYYVSREGVTGVQRKLAGGIEPRIRALRKHTRIPIVVGFGISTPAQVRAVSRLADGCVVGSAIVQRIADLGRSPRMVPVVSRFVRSLVAPLRGGRMGGSSNRRMVKSKR